MGKIIVFFVIVSCVSNAQDTLIWKDNSKMAVNLIDIRDDTVMYTKSADTLAHNCHLSRLISIYYKDGSRTDLDGLYLEPTADSNNITKYRLPLHERDMELFNRGIRDANANYKYEDYFTSRRSVSPFDLRWGTHLGVITLSPIREFDIEFPDKELYKKADYRAGYMYKLKRKRRKYTCVTVAALLVPCTFFALIASAMSN